MCFITVIPSIIVVLFAINVIIAMIIVVTTVIIIVVNNVVIIRMQCDKDDIACFLYMANRNLFQEVCIYTSYEMGSG